MRALIVFLAACSVHATPLPAEHPASPRAPSGRLAPAPPALRAGVVEYKDVPPLEEAPPPEHHHH